MKATGTIPWRNPALLLASHTTLDLPPPRVGGSCQKYMATECQVRGRLVSYGCLCFHSFVIFLPEARNTSH